MSIPEGSGERPDWARPAAGPAGDLGKGPVDMTTVVISRPGPVRQAFAAPSKTVTIEPKQLQSETSPAV